MGCISQVPLPSGFGTWEVPAGDQQAESERGQDIYPPSFQLPTDCVVLTQSSVESFHLTFLI